MIGGPDSKRRRDPHKWEAREALLILDEHGKQQRVLNVLNVNVCGVCGIWCEGSPDYIHDLPACVEAAQL